MPRIYMASKKKQARLDSHGSTFSDYYPYIDLSNHTHHNSLFNSVEFFWICFGMVVCVVNSRIGLWCRPICIEDGDYGLGCILKGVESKVFVVMGFVCLQMW